jgi:hypothetical protein
MLLLNARETTMGFFRPILKKHGISAQHDGAFALITQIH